MPESHTSGEMHGCVVCGRLYQLYVVYDSHGNYVDCKVMTPGGKVVANPARPLVACEKHSDRDIEAAVERAYPRKNKSAG
jgi:hypothetical protein